MIRVHFMTQEPVDLHDGAPEIVNVWCAANGRFLRIESDVPRSCNVLTVRDGAQTLAGQPIPAIDDAHLVNLYALLRRAGTIEDEETGRPITIGPNDTPQIVIVLQDEIRRRDLFVPPRMPIEDARDEAYVRRSRLRWRRMLRHADGDGPRRMMLATLAEIVRPYAPNAADELESPTQITEPKK